MLNLKWAAAAAMILFAAGVARPAGREIYPDPSRAKADLTTAIRKAGTEHKRVLVDFGGNWCPDCQVLDIYLHNPQNQPILESNFVLVHINIGHMDENVDIAQHYDIPLEKGVPALAVLTEQGKLLYSQRNGQFETMRSLQPGSVTKFLVQWKPLKEGCSMVVVNC